MGFGWSNQGQIGYLKSPIFCKEIKDKKMRQKSSKKILIYL